MKVRWTRGGVRLRITPSELDALMQDQSVSEELALPGAHWRAVITPGDAPTELTLEDGELHCHLSAADRDRLAAPDAEGIYFQIDNGQTDGGIRYFIEKDFPCAHPRPPEAQEPPSETFSPPPGFAERHRTC